MTEAPQTQPPAPEVRHNREKGRFEIEMDGGTAALEYSIKDGRIVMSHTFVPPEHRGRGYGDQLARAALDYAGQEQLEVVPLCPFVKSFMARQ